VDNDGKPISRPAVVAAGRRMGADVIEVNHPYSGYGYFENLKVTVVRAVQKSSAVPGGYDTGFDLVEIVPDDHDGNAKTLKRVWQMWNEGHRAYLAAGSDVHDVWIDESGSSRTYVYVGGQLSIEKFVEGLKAGRSFASQGPLVYPDILFGSEVYLSAGDELALTYSVEAVSGLRSVQLIERGNEIETSLFDGAVGPVEIDFSVSPEGATWYSLIVKDMNGKFAYTNPVWVMVTK